MRNSEFMPDSRSCDRLLPGITDDDMLIPPNKSVNSTPEIDIDSDEEDDLDELLEADKNEEDKEIEIRLSMRRWLVLFIFCQITMANGAIWITFPSISNIVTNYYKVDYFMVNWFSMSYLLAYAIFALPASIFLTKVGVKATVLVAATLNATGACFRYAGIDPNRFVFVAVGQLFAAIGSAFVLQVPPKLAAVWFGEHERGKATSIGVLMNLVGVAVGFVQPTYLVKESKSMDTVRDGMRQLLTSQALFCVACVILAYAFVNEKPKHPPSQSEALRDQITTLHLPLKTAIRRLFKSRSFNLTTQAYAILFGIMTCISTLLNQTVKSRFEFVPDSGLGMLGFTATLIGAAFTFGIGIIIDKFQKYKITAIILFSISTLSMAGFTVTLIFSRSFLALAIMFCIFNAALLPYLSCGLEQISEITYPVEEDISCAFPLIFGNFYGFVTVFLFGWLMKKGLVEITYFIITSIVGVGLLLVILAKVPMRRTKADHCVVK